MVDCHYCGKKVQTRLNHEKEPTYYFKQVRADNHESLYWCNWNCIERFIKETKRKPGVTLHLS